MFWLKRRDAVVKNERTGQQTMHQAKLTAMHFFWMPVTLSPFPFSTPKSLGFIPLLGDLVLLKQLLGISGKIKFTLADFIYSWWVFLPLLKTQLQTAWDMLSLLYLLCLALSKMQWVNISDILIKQTSFNLIIL